MHFDLLVEDSKDLTSLIVNVKFCFVKRSANVAAHVVAKASHSLSDLQVWVSLTPEFLLPILLSDIQ